MEAAEEATQWTVIRNLSLTDKALWKLGANSCAHMTLKVNQFKHLINSNLYTLFHFFRTPLL